MKTRCVAELEATETMLAQILQAYKKIQDSDQFGLVALHEAASWKVRSRKRPGREKSRHMDRCVYSRRRSLWIIHPERDDWLCPKRLIYVGSCCFYGNSQFGHIVCPVYRKNHMHAQMHPPTPSDLDLTASLTYLPALTLLDLLAVGNQKQHQYRFKKQKEHEK